MRGDAVKKPKRLARMLPVLLTWTLSQAPGCTPCTLRLFEAHIFPDHTFGLTTQDLPLDTFAIDLAPTQPEAGHAVAWKVPLMIDADGGTLAAECQVSGFMVDGLQWTGM